MNACRKALDWLRAKPRTWRQLVEYDPGWASWAMARDIDWCRNLLDAGANVHEADDAALCEAACRGHADIVQMLIAAGANIHTCKDAALRDAAAFGRTDVVRLLLAAGADVHAYEDEALRWAADGGHTKIVRMLLDAGADVHACSDFALRWAAAYGHAEVVRLLLQHIEKTRTPYNVTVRARMLRSALYMAVTRDRTDIVRMLLDAGSGINDTILREAALCNRTEILRLLKEAGAKQEDD